MKHMTLRTLAMISLVLGTSLWAQGGGSGVLIGQLDPTSPTLTSFTQITPLAPSGPIRICGSDANAVFAFCNFTEQPVLIGINPPLPNAPFWFTIPPMSCESFNPTWIAPTIVTVNGIIVAVLVDC